jgi:hypothetical protein
MLGYSSIGLRTEVLRCMLMTVFLLFAVTACGRAEKSGDEYKNLMKSPATQFLADQIGEKKEEYDRRAVEHGDSAFNYRVWAAILAAVTTLALAIKFPPHWGDRAKLVALICSVLAPLLVTMDSLYASGAQFIEYKTAYREMKLIQTDLVYTLLKNNSDLSESDRDRIFKNFKDVVSRVDKATAISRSALLKEIEVLQQLTK